MKIVHVSHSDSIGGAARAAYRLHKSIRTLGIDSRMLVADKKTDDWTVKRRSNRISHLFGKLRWSIGIWISSFIKSSNPILHSVAVVPSRWSQKLNASDADVVHLHWINGEMMSIRDLRDLKKPTIWTLHDMWAFCGAEHVSFNTRYRDGYKTENRPANEKGIDLNRWTANRKLKNWKEPIQVVAPSRWLAECIKDSVIMKGWPVEVIPNAIDTNTWFPTDKIVSRDLFKLPKDTHLILFSAWGGTSQMHKGFDLAESALDYLATLSSSIELVVCGQSQPEHNQYSKIKVNYIGHLHDDISMNLLYSAVDVVVIPSRIDNLPNAGTEAQSCGVPVVAFNVCGLPDVVEHLVTGYLAVPFDTLELAKGILWVIDKSRHEQLRIAARQRAVNLWSHTHIATKYANLYAEILK